MSNILNSILAAVEELQPDSGFSVSSVFVSEKTIVLENPGRDGIAFNSGFLLGRKLEIKFPEIKTELYVPDNDGTCLAITYA